MNVRIFVPLGRMPVYARAHAQWAHVHPYARARAHRLIVFLYTTMMSRPAPGPLALMVPVWSLFHMTVALLVVSYTRVVASDPGVVCVSHHRHDDAPP